MDKTVTHFRQEEVSAILEALTGKPRDLFLFQVGCHLGLRGGDLLSLMWIQVLNASLSDIAESVSIVEQKTKRHATFPLIPPVRQALKSWWRICECPTEGYIWPSRKGGNPMLIQHLHYLVNQWAKAAGLKGHYGSHSLRKTFGRAFLENGGNLSQLSVYFGHHNLDTTHAYLGVDIKEVNYITQKIDLTKPKKINLTNIINQQNVYYEFQRQKTVNTNSAITPILLFLKSIGITKITLQQILKEWDNE
jgi:integrase